MTTTASPNPATSILDLTDVPPESDGGTKDHGDPGIYGFDLTPFDSADGDDPEGNPEDVVPEAAEESSAAATTAGVDVGLTVTATVATASPEPAAPPAAKLVAQVHRRILRARKVLRLRHAEYLDAKESTKAAKERFSAAQTDLNALIGELCKALSGEGQLPLPLAVDADPEDEDEDEDKGDLDQQPCGPTPIPATPAATTAPTAEPDPAKSAPLSVLAKFGLTEAKAEKLAEADVHTVADLEACINAGRLMKIKGIGEKAVDKIEDAVLAWREQNPAPDEPAA